MLVKKNFNQHLEVQKKTLEILEKKIYLASEAISNCLKNNGFDQLILRLRSELDLTDQMATQKFFRDEKPEVGESVLEISMSFISFE